MKNICVYCGSNSGNPAIFLPPVRRLGKLLADRNHTLIYGGGNVGLMGALADSVMASGGTVIGVITQALVELEVAHFGITELIVVDSMHERKAGMAELSDSFIALPGGYGTLEELFEILTWSQLGLHAKPCGVLNINHYFDYLIRFLENSVHEKFIHPDHLSMLIVEEDAETILDKFSGYQNPTISKLIKV